MNTGLLHLHNLLRWVVLIALLVSIVSLILKKDSLKVSKVLLISAHSTLVLGLYQYFFGPVGFVFIKTMGMAAAMKDKLVRFWAVEHILTMLIAIALITIGHVTDSWCPFVVRAAAKEVWASGIMVELILEL